MIKGVLSGLLSEQLRADACAFSTARALIDFLAQRPEVRGVRQALRDQRLSDGSLRRFVGDLQTEFIPAAWSSFDLALAALAVAVRDRPTAFAREYLDRLKTLCVQELPLAPRVAAEVLRGRRHLATNRRVSVSLGRGG